MLKIAGHKTNQHHAEAVVLTWVLAMILLAHRGAFAMVHLVGSALCPPDVEPQSEPEVCRMSLFKSIGRLILAMGTQIVVGTGYDLASAADEWPGPSTNITKQRSERSGPPCRKS